MKKFYSGYARNWCIGANVKEPTKYAMVLKMNNIVMPPFVYDGELCANINMHSGNNFNFIVSNAEEKEIDRLKLIIEKILIANDQII